MTDIHIFLLAISAVFILFFFTWGLMALCMLSGITMPWGRAVKPSKEVRDEQSEDARKRQRSN